MSDVFTNHIVEIDLDKPLKPENLDGVLYLHDRGANVFRTKFRRGNQAVAMVGVGVVGLFTGSDGVTHYVEGSINGTDSTVDVALTAECYQVPGRFKLAIQIRTGDHTRTVRLIRGFIHETMQTDIWQDVSALVIESAGTGKATVEIQPFVDTGEYSLYEEVDGENVFVTRFTNTLTKTISAAAGYHAYYIQPKMGKVLGNMCGPYETYLEE